MKPNPAPSKSLDSSPEAVARFGYGQEESVLPDESAAPMVEGAIVLAAELRELLSVEQILMAQRVGNDGHDGIRDGLPCLRVGDDSAYLEPRLRSEMLRVSG